MFKVIESRLTDGSPVFDVVGSICGQQLTLGAPDEIHACEMARALNGAASIAIDQPLELDDDGPRPPAEGESLCLSSTLDYADFDARR